MLNFVLGTSGVSKTKYLYNLMADKAKAGDNKLLFLVPDQVSFDTEKAFLQMLGPKLVNNIKVFGFSRLCDYVFEQTGNRFLSFADEGVRNVVMNIAIDQVIDKLSVFSKRARCVDLSEMMLNCIKEYKKCSVTSSMIYNAADAVEDESLSTKLYEVALIYDTYDAVMSKSYIDPLDNLSKVSSILRENNLFSDYTIAIDSYYGFTAAEYDLLSLLIKDSKDTFVALTTDNLNGSNGDLFFVSDRTKKRLAHIAKLNDVKIAPNVVLTQNTRFNTSDLKAVEENIFRIDTNATDSDGSLVAFEAKSIYDECEFVSKEIKKLVYNDGYTYSDIAVITRNIDKYCGVLDTVFDKYNISYFIDKPQDIDTKPLVRFVMSCFDIICGGFDKDDVLSLLKTGLTDITVEQIADFENYLFTWDISGKKLLSQFVENPRGFADEFKDSDKEKLAQIENTRATVIDNLRQFYFDTKDTTGLNIAKALYRLMNKLNVESNLLLMCDQLDQNFDTELSKEQIRYYNTFVEVLDKMVAVISDYNISAKRFGELLHINFLNTDVSFIPRFADQVDIACADRSLLSEKKAVFVIGAIDSEFPHTPVESGLFSDDEKNKLLQYDIAMSDSVQQLIPTEKYLAYKALTSASDKLYVSYHRFSLSGKKIEPSELITTLPHCISNLFIGCDVDYKIDDSMWTLDSAFDYMVSHYNSTRSDISTLKQFFLTVPKYSDVVLAIEKTRAKEPKRITDPLVAKKLFGSNMTLSASQVDVFSKCRFQYFCNYGLRVRQRRQAKIDSLEYGTLMHYIFEKFLSAHKNDNFSLITIEQVESEVSSLLEEYFDLHLGSKDAKSQRFIYLYYRVKSIASRIVWRMVCEFKQSKFRPEDFELSIGDDIPSYKLNVDGDINVYIKGSVDRVDIMEDNGNKYIRVIDYKTGTKKYNLFDVLYGINLQMFIYLSAINKNASDRYGSTVLPAGVLYVSAESPAVDTDKVSDPSAFENPENSVMKGVVLNDINVLKGMDEKGSVYIPVSYDGDNVIDKDGSLATLEQFGAMFRLVDTTVANMARALCDGDIEAMPTIGVHNACDYCIYNSICGYSDGDKAVEIRKLKPEDVMTQITKEADYE